MYLQYLNESGILRDDYIVTVAIVLLNLYVGFGPGFRVPCFVCPINIPDVAASICAEADSGVPHGLPFYDRAFGQ